MEIGGSYLKTQTRCNYLVVYNGRKMIVHECDVVYKLVKGETLNPSSSVLLTHSDRYIVMFI